MIEGASDITRVMDVLRKLDVIDVEMDVTEGATYAMTYMGHTMRIQETGAYIEEEVSDEEMDIMSMCDADYASWYVDQLILEDEDE